MSVADALRIQCASVAVTTKYAPSILYSREEASRIPLAEQAALTNNSLSLLSTVDERFPEFAASLLVNHPVSRQILTSEEEKRLGKSIINIARHLAPIFPIRHSQRIYEWIVNGLHTGLIGSDKEIDTLLVSCLPFYSTKQFLTFIRAVILPKPRHNWKWLQSVIPTTSKSKSKSAVHDHLPTLSFMITSCPPNIHNLAIQFAFELVHKKIPSTHAVSFISNITARWIALNKTSLQLRKSVVLTCLHTIDSILKISATKNIQPAQFICALLTVCVSAVVAGIDSDIASLIANAAPILIDYSDDVAETAFGCLAVVFTRFPHSYLFADNALQLLQHKHQLATLDKIGKHAPSIYVRIVQSVFNDDDVDFSNEKQSMRILQVLKQLLLHYNTTYNTNELVTDLLVKLLHIYSLPVAKEEEEDEKFGDRNEKTPSKLVHKILVDIIKPLSHGRFATAVDSGLREHFDNRKKKKNDTRYDFIDKVLMEALHGTSYEIIKSKSSQESEDTATADGMMMLSALDHPERTVRKHALDQITQKFSSLQQAQVEQVSEELTSKILSIVQFDSIPRVAITACGCAMTLQSSFSKSSKSNEFIHVIGNRLLKFIDDSEDSSKDKVVKYANVAREYLIVMCQKMVQSNENESIDSVFSLLLGVIMNDFLLGEEDDESLVHEAYEVLKSAIKKNQDRFSREIELLGEKKKITKKMATKIIEHLAVNTSFEHAQFLESLAGWRPSWIYPIVKLLCVVVRESTDTQQIEKVLKASIHALGNLKAQSERKEAVKNSINSSRSLKGQTEKGELAIDASINSLSNLSQQIESEDFIGTITYICDAYCSKTSTISKDEQVMYSSLVWPLVASTLSDSNCGNIIKVLFKNMGEEKVVNMLKSSFSQQHDTQVQRAGAAAAFRWYTNFSCARDVEQGSKNNGLISLVTAYYGNSAMLREEAFQFCKLLHKQKKFESSSFISKDVKAFIKDVCNPSQAPVVTDREKTMSNLIVEKLMRLIQSIGELKEIPNSIKPLKNDPSHAHTVSSIFNSIDGNMTPKESLPLLRALLNFEYHEEQAYSATCSLLIKYLEQPWQSDDTDTAEAVARIIILLSRSTQFSLSFKEADMSKCFSAVVTTLIRFMSENKNQSLPGSQNGLIPITIMSGGVVFLQALASSKKMVRSQQKFIDLLLSFSSRSSSMGLFARDVLDASEGTVFPLRVIEAPISELAHNLKITSKKMKIAAGDLIEEDRKETEEEGSVPATEAISKLSVSIGALETINQWCEKLKDDEKPKLGKCSVKDSLWHFIKLTTNKLAEKNDRLDEQHEFVLQLSLDTLRKLYKIDIGRKQTKAVSLDTLVGFLFYPGKHIEITDENDTSIMRAVRKIALDLVDVLAPLYQEELQSIAPDLIASLLSGKYLQRAAESLKILIPCLLAGGCDWKSISKWICKAAFSAKRKHEEKTELLSIIANCCGGSQEAISLCLSNMVKINENHMPLEDLGKECSKVLDLCRISPITDMKIISNMDPKVLCSFVSEYFKFSMFLPKLFQAGRASADEDIPAKDCSRSEDALLKAYTTMILSIGKCKDGPHKDKAMKSAIGTLPMPALISCIDHIMQSKHVKVKIEVFSTLASKLDDHYDSILPDWRYDIHEIIDPERGPSNDRIRKENWFIQAITTSIGKVMKSEPSSLKITQLKRSAIKCVLNLINKYSWMDTKVAMQLAIDTMDVLDESLVKVMEKSEDAQEYRRSVIAAFNCLCAIVTSLKERSIGIVPQLLDAGMTFLEWAFDGNCFISSDGNPLKVLARLRETKPKNFSEKDFWLEESLMTAAINACTCLIDEVPQFFGQKSLQRLISLVVRDESNRLVSLLEVGVQKLPSSSAVSAVLSSVERLRENRASAVGVATLLESTKNALPLMKKSHIKLQAKSLLKISIRCLEYGRGEEGSNGKIEFPCKKETMKDALLAKLKLVDEKTANVLTELTLRLPESEFKVLFDELAHWCSNGTIASQLANACETMGIGSFQSNLLRAMPFYSCCLKLFQILEAIMVPYYMQQLEQVLSIISLSDIRREFLKMKNKKAKQKAKKRKRTNVEADEAEAICEQFTTLQGELQDVCIDGLKMMLNQTSSVNMLNAEVVVKIQEGLIKCFDERNGECSKVIEAFCALCVRVSVMRSHADGSKEESRELLNGVSRQILLRTREDTVSLRKGALLASARIAESVGDEYSVTLPETMPIIAEVVDDEDEEVRKAAKAFVGVMESIAGESLTDQLK